MKFQIFARWSNEVRAEVELDAKWESRPVCDQRGEAIRVALARGSNLSDSDLRGSNLRGSDLRDSNLRGSNLSDSNLRGSDLRGSDLRGSNLSGSNLSGSNLSDSNLSGLLKEVAVPSLHRKILAAIDAGGKLDMSNWHTCETMHCRAGWAIHLAGGPGKVLEFCYGSAAAGALIHLASCPDMEKVPNFYANNEEALADIKRNAELEAPLEVAESAK